MLRKAVRKHKAAAATIGAGLVALVVFAGSMWWAWREVSAQRDRAEQNLASVRGLARAMIFEINDRIDDLRGATAARQALLENARAFLDRVEGQARDDDAFRRELADAHLRVSQIHAGLYMPRVGVDGGGPPRRGKRSTQPHAIHQPDTAALHARILDAEAGLAFQKRRYAEAAASFER